MAMSRPMVLALLAAAALSSGCVYRPDIQQGNLLSVKDIEQIEAGMTRSQVRFLLGTPMVSDPFTPYRWDYVYRMVYGRSRMVDSAHFVVYFDGDKVTRYEMIDVQEPQQRQADGKMRLWNPFRRQAPDADPAAAGPADG
ncbi:MAG: outer membrane protein assembly factor BamE [Steroidobacteraceae bacterium]|nr:outer membrane protein assembly factor BamE [Steroidobacteraceae bacterium]